MARFNEILASRFTRGLNALLRVQELEGLRTLSPELVPTILVEGDRPENAYLKAENLWAHQASTNAVVGERSMYLVNNPAGSGILVTVTMMAAGGLAAGERILFGSLASADIDVTLGTNQMQAHNVRDRRLETPGPIRVHFGEIVGAGLLSIHEQAFVGVNAEMVYARALPYVLPPGWAMGVSIETPNMGARFSSAGRLRVLAPEEASV